MTAKAKNSRSRQHPYALPRLSDPSLAVLVAQLVFRCHSAPAELALEAAERYLGEQACVPERAASGVEAPVARHAAIAAWVEFVCLAENALVPGEVRRAAPPMLSASELVELTIAVALFSRDAISLRSIPSGAHAAPPGWAHR
jgi:hypothetical protein